MASQAIGLGASILSGITGGKGAKKAANAQIAAYDRGISEQRRQFDETQQNFEPFRAAGVGALGGVQELLGLSGGGQQQTAIDALKASPGFTSLFNTGADTILQNASATGGLRGGNTQNSLANFGSSLLSTVIQQQLGNLGGLVNNGLGATNSIGQFGQQTANNVTQLLGQQGGAKATGIAGQTAALQGIFNSVGSAGKFW